MLCRQPIPGNCLANIRLDAQPSFSQMQLRRQTALRRRVAALGGCNQVIDAFSYSRRIGCLGIRVTQSLKCQPVGVRFPGRLPGLQGTLGPCRCCRISLTTRMGCITCRPANAPGVTDRGPTGTAGRRARAWAAEGRHHSAYGRSGGGIPPHPSRAIAPGIAAAASPGRSPIQWGPPGGRAVYAQRARMETEPQQARLPPPRLPLPQDTQAYPQPPGTRRWWRFRRCARTELYTGGARPAIIGLSCRCSLPHCLRRGGIMAEIRECPAGYRPNLGVCMITWPILSVFGMLAELFLVARFRVAAVFPAREHAHALLKSKNRLFVVALAC